MVAAWRGVWMSWDIATASGTASGGAKAGPPPSAEELAERRRNLASGLFSHVCATVLLLRVFHLSSVLAPPARIGVLSDKMSWAHARPSRYLEDLGMFLNNMPKQKYNRHSNLNIKSSMKGAP